MTRFTSNAPRVPRLRRAYYDCRYGQLHLHQAVPPGGGFDEATALLCIPGREADGGFFHSLLMPLGMDRSVYAVDLPGCGQSDPVGNPVGVADAAAALGDLLDSLYLRSVDVLAHGGGVAVALALQQQRPAAIRRMVLSQADEQQRALSRNLSCPVLLSQLPPAAQEAEPALRAFLGSAPAFVPG